MLEVRFPWLRFALADTLLHFSDYRFHREYWGIERAKTVPNYVGVNEAMEGFVEDVHWEMDRELIGVVFRNEAELEACKAVKEAIMALNERKGWHLYPDEEYFEDPEWKNIIRLSRHALRVMLQGDE